MQPQKLIRVARVAGKRIKPLDVRSHLSILYNSMEILKNDNNARIFEYFRKNFTSLKCGLRWGDRAEAAAAHLGPNLDLGKGSQELAKKYHTRAKIAIEAKQPDLAIFYMGTVIHIIQDAGVPLHSPVSLVMKGDIYEEQIDRLLSLSQRRHPPCGAIELEDLGHYIDELQNTLIQLRIFHADLPKEDSHGAIAEEIFRHTEKLCAGYLMMCYKLLIEAEDKIKVGT